MPTPTDKKEAALISVGLSGQLINAALTLIALSGAFFTFILDKKSPTISFYLFYAFSFVAFTASIFCGGRGTDSVKKNGENGNWTSKPSNEPNWFNMQALFLLLAVFSLAILPLLGRNKTEYSELGKLQSSMNRRDSLQSELFKKLLNAKPVHDTIYLARPISGSCKKARNRFHHNKPLSGL